MDRREHHRAQLRLPVRIRWNTPFGQKIEVCKTLDISRGGLLVPSGEPHAPGIPLWVTFPYDTSLGDGQPEMLARVVRAALKGDVDSGNNSARTSDECTIALHFSPPGRPESNGNGRTKEQEQRESPRRVLALPFRVRPRHIPWFEQAMTLDVSAHGVRFLSSREYQPGDLLLVAFEAATLAPWPSGAEVAARVLRIEAMPESPALSVAMVREPQ